MVDQGRMAADQVRQLHQYFLDFIFLIQLQLPPFVIKLNRRQRLDKKGCAAAPLIMDDSLNPPLEFRSQGDDITPAALGNQGLLQILGGWNHDPVQLFHQPAISDG